MPLITVDPAEFYRDMETACCADPRWNGCPHPLAGHGPDGRCTAASCRCEGVLRHRNDCIHQPPTAAQDEG